MKSIRAWVHRLAGAFAGRRSERELAAELESHLQLHVDDNLRAGHDAGRSTPPRDDRARRRREHQGGVSRSPRPARCSSRWSRDLRYGVAHADQEPGLRARRHRDSRPGHRRQLRDLHRRQRGGAAAAAVRRRRSHHALWHTPPQTTFAGMRMFSLSPANFIDWEAQSHVVRAMAIYRGGRRTLTGQGEPEPS